MLLILIISVGTIYASDNSQSVLSDSVDDDNQDLDENLDLDDDSDDDLDDGDLDDDSDDDLNDEDLDDDSDDDLDDGDLDDDLDDGDLDDDSDDEDLDVDLDGDLDYNESDLNYSDFDCLKFKITYYLEKYGNCSHHFWMFDEDFSNEYQLYLFNSSDYKLNESKESYETYLKIFDSITSTFGDFNLTENETDYLKFMVIYFLNHYGNVSENYTWDDNESFANYTPPLFLMKSFLAGASPISDLMVGHGYSAVYSPVYNVIVNPLGNSTDINQTSANNQTFKEVPKSWDFNIALLLLLVVVLILLVL